MKMKFVQNAVVGMGIGFPVVLLCMTLFGGFNAVVAEFLVWMVASALYGILSGVMNDEKTERSLPVSLGLHCLGCLLITLGAAVLCGYVKTAADLLPVLIPFVVIYVLIYALCICVMKHNEKQINQLLKEE